MAEWQPSGWPQGMHYAEVVKKVVIVASGICMTKSDNERLVKEFGANEIKEILIPLDVQDFLKAMDFVHKRKPWLPSFCWKHVFQEQKRKGRASQGHDHRL
eukprot:TRINITY_DN5291_c0_g1_i3.p2 TRINITY_DN5291_c0_g1~~TRINITY_DN5291_c0_g1_i3.p2  ORF type:complete len:101 (-),score=20.57 TRINITY_DN5291_c0_g1_i3:256-558(-)